jgi:hypothetical protein
MAWAIAPSFEEYDDCCEWEVSRYTDTIWIAVPNSVRIFHVLVLAANIRSTRSLPQTQLRTIPMQLVFNDILQSFLQSALILSSHFRLGQNQKLHPTQIVWIYPFTFSNTCYTHFHSSSLIFSSSHSWKLARTNYMLWSISLWNVFSFLPRQPYSFKYSSHDLFLNISTGESGIQTILYFVNFT